MIISILGWIFLLFRPAWDNWRGVVVCVGVIKLALLIVGLSGVAALVSGGRGAQTDLFEVGEFALKILMLWAISVLICASVGALIVYLRLKLKDAGEEDRAAINRTQASMK